MVRVSEDFFKMICNNDIIYHYTKAATAIDYIFYNNQLRFSNCLASNDPIESVKPNRGTVYYDNMVGYPESEENRYNMNELHKFISEYDKLFYQICFCKNEYDGNFDNENYHSSFNGHEESFGFTKLRMWDQYADKFSGVCIAFSKERLLALNEKLDLIPGDVDYLKFIELKGTKIGDLNFNALIALGQNNYKNKLENQLKKSFFCKHVDYIGENEFRIGTLYQKEKEFPMFVKGELKFEKAIMLNITGCVKAIFVSSFANEKQKSELLMIANNLNVELIEMVWKHDSFETRDYKKSIEFINKINI